MAKVSTMVWREYVLCNHHAVRHQMQPGEKVFLAPQKDVYTDPECRPWEAVQASVPSEKGGVDQNPDRFSEDIRHDSIPKGCGCV